MVQHPQHWIHSETSRTHCPGPQTYLREPQAPPWKENDILQRPWPRRVSSRPEFSARRPARALLLPGSSWTHGDMGLEQGCPGCLSPHLSSALISEQFECPEK